MFHLDVSQEGLHVNESLWVVNLRAKFTPDGLAPLVDSCRVVLGVLNDLLKDLVNDGLALSDQRVIDVIAVNEHHVESDLLREILSDLNDLLLIKVDLVLKLFSGVLVSFSQIQSDGFLLSQKELIVLIDVYSLAYDLHIVFDDLLDSVSGSVNNFIIFGNGPQVDLVGSGNGVLWSRDGLAGTHQALNH